MRLTIDEYSKQFKMSKEMINSKLRQKKLNYVIEESITYIIVNQDPTITPQKAEVIQKTKIITKPKTTVATVISLYQRENTQLKNKIVQLEAKIDSLIDDKEQMLRDERDKIEDIYSKKDEQLKNILELINAKMMLEEQEKIPTIHHDVVAIESKEEYPTLVELKEYLRTLSLKSYQRKIIKKRFTSSYDSDIRIIQKNGKLYMDFDKYDYTDLLAY